MVNILRDLAADLRLGRCYLPEERLTAIGLSPAALLQPANESRVRPLLNDYIRQSEDHLHAGWMYTHALPWGSVRVRLACAWPILIGFRTLRLLRAGNVLDPEQRMRISRTDIRNCLWRSVLYYPWPAAWEKLINPQDCQPK
jgi:farnesyl-diphosphate farnesyltransferase